MTEQQGIGALVRERPDPNKLLRVLGVFFGVAIVVGGVIGQGILRSPGLVAQGIPYAELFLLIWLLGAVFTAVDAMTTVELGASLPKAGGPFVFADRAFGRIGGFYYGWLDASLLILATGYLCVVVAEFLQRLGLFTGAPLGVVAATIVVCLGLVNATGTKASGALQSGASAIKALVLLTFAGLCFLLRGDAPPETTGPGSAVFSLAGVALAVVAVQQTYYGSTTAVYFSEEVDAPERNLPRAVFLGVAAITFVYMSIVAALVFVLPMAQIAASNLPVADALGAVIGERGAIAVTLFALFSVAAVANVTVMQQSRTIFAMARAGNLPKILAKVAKNGTPITALTAAVVIGALLAGTGVYERLLAISAAISVFLNVVMGMSAIILRVREPSLPRPFKMPLYPLPALFTIVANLSLGVFFTIADWQNTRWAFVFFLIAIPFWVWSRGRARSASL